MSLASEQSKCGILYYMTHNRKRIHLMLTNLYEEKLKKHKLFELFTFALFQESYTMFINLGN